MKFESFRAHHKGVEIQCIDFTEQNREKRVQTTLLLNLEHFQDPQYPVPCSVKIFGPYNDICQSVCYFDQKHPFELNNISGKTMLHKTQRSQEIFKEKYIPCVQHKQNFFGHISHLYHIYGNMHYQNISSLLCFKGFKKTEHVEWMIKEVIEPEMIQDIKLTINMLSATCALGVHVDISEDCMLRRKMMNLYKDKIYFRIRHDDYCNIILFRIDDVPAVFHSFPPEWSYACTSFNCGVTKNGILTARISWSSNLAWNEKQERTTLKALEALTDIILQIV